MMRVLQGTSLIEVLIAITILSFTIAPLVGLFMFSSKGSGESTYRVQALFLAHAIIEAIKARIYRNPRAINEFPYSFEASPVKRSSYSFGEKYHLDFFRNVHGPNQPVTTESPLYEQFGRYRVYVTFEGAGKPKRYLVKAKVEWSFKDKLQNLELSADVECHELWWVR